jgi:hypothetical protein
MKKTKTKEWNGMAPCGLHGADYKGQTCTICHGLNARERALKIEVEPWLMHTQATVDALAAQRAAVVKLLTELKKDHRCWRSPLSALSAVIAAVEGMK